MLAAIPYFEIGVFTLDIPGVQMDLPIDPWTTLVCLGFVLGLEMARHRGIKLGLDVRDVVDSAVFVVVSGFVVAHWFTLFLYKPHLLTEKGWTIILRFWEVGFSSFGGFLGAVLGMALFFKVIRPRPFWRFADVVMYGFPFGWVLGRLGCASVHDHVGSLTTFPLAMDFDHGARLMQTPEGIRWLTAGDPAIENGIRHELGLYEASYMLILCAVFLALGRRDRVPGMFAGLFAVLYAPVRFGLDFLRNTDLSYQDARYFGLTPAQYGCIAMLGLGIWLLGTRDWKGFRPWPMDGRADQGQAPPAEA